MKVVHYLFHPKKILNGMLSRVASFIKDDENYIKMEWKLRMDYPLNLDNPLTFQEKLQWLKLYNRHPIFTRMVDKVEVKEYVAGIIGEEYIIPTLGVWDSPDEINFNDLPMQFVLKCNHNSGKGMYICRNKHELNTRKVKRLLNSGLHENYFIKGREWPYKNVRRRIIAEEFLTDGNKELTDYKFYCFNGVPRFCQVIKDRHTKETIDFYDMDWKRQEFVGLNPAFGPAFGPSVVPASEPHNYMEMQHLAKVLSQGIPFVRIDLYEVSGKTYFGEITFFPQNGMGVFTPREWDRKLGDMIVLPY